MTKQGENLVLEWYGNVHRCVIPQGWCLLLLLHIRSVHLDLEIQGFLWVVPTNTGIFLHSSNYAEKAELSKCCW